MKKAEVISKICAQAPGVIRLIEELKTLTPGTRGYSIKRKELDRRMKTFIQSHLHLDQANKSEPRDVRRQALLDGMYSQERVIV